MSRGAERHGWSRGCGRPLGEGVYEVTHMGRRTKVQVNRSEGGELRVFGVPGHMKEGVPVSDFDMYIFPRIDDSRRSATANLGNYDRGVSRVIAALTALRAIFTTDEHTVFAEKMSHDIDSEMVALCSTVSDHSGVTKAVAERLQVWDIEDHDGIPLPSSGPGAPPEGKNANGRDL